MRLMGIVDVDSLALRVNTKLGTLSLSEDILLPRVHDKLDSSQQTLQRSSASESAGMSPKSTRVSAMLAWSTVMVFRIDLYKVYHLS